MAEVKSYRHNGRVKQKVIKYLGKEVDGMISRRTGTADISVKQVKQSLDVLCVDKIAEELGLKSLKDRHVIALVYSHLLDSRSINKMEEWLKFTEIPQMLGIETSTQNLYRSLTSLSEQEFHNIEEQLSEFFRGIDKDRNTAIIDVTDTYFEGSGTKEKPRRGKDSKVSKLIQFALAVTMEDGFPLLCRDYSGNLSGIDIFKEMNLELAEKGLSSVIVDRGMMSMENLKMILALGMKVIGGVRKNSKLLKKFILGVDRNKIFSPKCRINLKNTSVYIKSFEYMEGRLIVVYNPHTEILKKERAFDKESEEWEQKGYGYNLIYHNTSFEDKIVVRKYYDKDVVERAFKQLKGILKLRPIRVWLKEHVKGHFRICFLAYAILSYMNFKLRKLDISVIDALDSLKRGYKVRLCDKTNNYEWDLVVPLEPKQKKIVKTLGVVYKN